MTVTILNLENAQMGESEIAKSESREWSETSVCHFER